MSLALAMSSGAMGKQAQDSYTASMITVVGIAGIVGIATLIGYGVSRTIAPIQIKPIQGGRHTRKRRT